MRLLSVDWDYFFREPSPSEDTATLYDWGHAENAVFMSETVWYMRASQFLQAGKELPTTTGEEVNFWSRFKFNPATILYATESHSQISKVFHNVTEIANFDAHHDAYKTAKEVKAKGTHSCEDWATYAAELGIKVTTFYPLWRKDNPLEKPRDNRVKTQLDPGAKFRRPFDRVFVCRSGAWTPTWLDKQFSEFIIRSHLDIRDNTEVREFNHQFAKMQAEEMTRIMKEQLEKIKQGHG